LLYRKGGASEDLFLKNFAKRQRRSVCHAFGRPLQWEGKKHDTISLAIVQSLCALCLGVCAAFSRGGGGGATPRAPE
jgi:hypothetical protein